MSEIAVQSLPMPSEDEPVSTQMSEKELELQAYYAWKNPCDEARLRVQENYGSCGPEKYYGPEVKPWENEKLSSEARQQVWTGGQIIEMNKKKRTFSQAAILLASSHDRARFFDDVKCDYLGDSKRLGAFREISPEQNHTGFSDVLFNYDKGILNAFSGNTIIHVRETLDPEAKTRSQRLFIVAIDLIAMDIQRLYADDKPQIESLDSPDLRYNEIIPLTSGTLQGMEAQLRVADDNPLLPYVRELFENQAVAQQAQLIRTAYDGWHYKPQGFAEPSKLHPIADLDQERLVIGQLGKALGYEVTDRGAIRQPFSAPEIAQ